jgi:hypothetical protein
MKKLAFLVCMLIGAHALHAQYLHYWDDSKPRRRSVPAPKPQQHPVEKEIVDVKPVIEAPPEIAPPLKIEAGALVTSVTLATNKITPLPEIVRKPVVFHDWPDKCPGLTGAVPVLINYVPAEIVIIVSEKFKGHLYSISTNKGPDNLPQYKLKVCEDGMIQYEYADYKGNIISEQ